MWSGTAETPGAGAGANDALTVAGLGACVVGVVLVLLLSRRILGSVGGLTTAARNPGRGDLSSRVAVKGNDEIAELGHAFNAMADSLDDSELQRRRIVADVAHELRLIKAPESIVQLGEVPAEPGVAGPLLRRHSSHRRANRGAHAAFSEVE